MLTIRHWSAKNSSGMHHAAEACAEAERRLGHDSKVIDTEQAVTWGEGVDADIHVNHTHLPDLVRERTTKDYRVVFVGHGTPEHVMENSINAAAAPGYGQPNGWMMLREWLRSADAVVTFWPRHQAFYQAMMPACRLIDCVPMGVDTAFWAGGVDNGKYAGTPSVWTSENQHNMKWVLDLISAWPDVRRAIPKARLHAHYIPANLHQFMIDYANSNGTSYVSYLSSNVYPHDSLRSIWKSFDFFLGLVRYGDHNCLSMQAAASGLKTISYRGNQYADYWVTEGDQREMARELVAIFKGQIAPRTDKLSPPDLLDMGRAMLAIYERILTLPPSMPPMPADSIKPWSASDAMPASVAARFAVPAPAAAPENGNGVHAEALV